MTYHTFAEVAKSLREEIAYGNLRLCYVTELPDEATARKHSAHRCYRKIHDWESGVWAFHPQDGWNNNINPDWVNAPLEIHFWGLNPGAIYPLTLPDFPAKNLTET